MKITLLCSSQTHPITPFLERWAEEQSSSHDVDIVRTASELKEKKDILFLISCNEVINEDIRQLYKATLVIHASDLPMGRGWSPHIWQIIEGASEIVVSLLEAEDKVDAGGIWKKVKVVIPKTGLYDEINRKIFEAEISLMNFAISNLGNINATQQNSAVSPTYFKKRTPKDSELDIKKSIEGNFNLMRVCDPIRFPAFFYIDGIKYNLHIQKDEPD